MEETRKSVVSVNGNETPSQIDVKTLPSDFDTLVTMLRNAHHPRDKLMLARRIRAYCERYDVSISKLVYFFYSQNEPDENVRTEIRNAVRALTQRKMHTLRLSLSGENTIITNDENKKV